MKVISRRVFLELLKVESVFDIDTFEGQHGEVVLSQKDDLRFLDFIVGDVDESQLPVYENREQTLVDWFLKILEIEGLQETYLFSPDYEWLKGQSKDPSFQRIKELMDSNHIRSSFPDAFYFGIDEQKLAKLFIRAFSVAGMRSYSDILFWLKCVNINLVASPCDHFDYHIYPNNPNRFAYLANAFLPSQEYRLVVK